MKRLQTLLAALVLLLQLATAESTSTHTRANRLAQEKSPYLLPHAHNPVDWFPWGKEAFAKAKQAGKPIFLSIGYATCHWCHVMEEECFEDEEVAALLNRYFVSIKVDREERPDIDTVYMRVARYLGGGNGWPLTVVMTPDGKPYFAGTFFPKDRKYGIEGLMTLLPRLYQQLYYDRRATDQAITQVERRLQPGPALELPDPNEIQVDLQATCALMGGMVDPVHGGTGRGMKFPRSHQMLYLLEQSSIVAPRTCNTWIRPVPWWIVSSQTSKVLRVDLTWSQNRQKSSCSHRPNSAICRCHPVTQ